MTKPLSTPTRPLKKRLYFLLPVDFTADSERAMKSVLAEFKREPAYECFGAGPDGGYSWKKGKMRQRPLGAKR